ncbi:MAG: hypothetical protein AVDCRST_MAG66-2603 [uncultured Pseudonocardia sp.]|uniref:Heparan-alpha-glucosaminide N-acetyltransferase catalytic domain-containing protein n=1 Tax=uncultured Pseudonocardia sp. TaxID=211455 RepID=A0A6J4PPX4_9PSEU|nr:MAG: hypothetical protein AVDCRST_MAG66-2603 [uncultured Pseudonocardia sp.]
MRSESWVLERPVTPSADPATGASPGVAASGPRVDGGKPRVIGVDVARGLALIGMMATHAYGAALDDNGDPTPATVLAGGRAATLFVLVAGVSLAFLSGGRTRLRGPERTGASAGLAVRAALVGAIGLALGYLGEYNGIDGILPLYGLLFLLAIPLLRCPPAVLLGIAAAATALGPVLIVATADAGLPGSAGADDPTFGALFTEPLGLLVQLFLTGAYPAAVYLGYLCVGLVIGRLDLGSRRVQWWLLAVGATLAVAARAVSAFLLHPMGGLARLIEQGDLGGDPAGVATLLWEPELTTSWWYLALPAPHSHTPVDMLHTLGSAAAVLGVALLLTRVPAVARLLGPLAAAGSMSLTLYSAHLVVLTTGVLEDEPLLLLLAMAVGALVLAAAWRGWFRQGPLEALVAKPAGAARRAAVRRVGGRATAPPSGGWVFRATRSSALFLAPLACAGVLTLVFLAGAATTGNVAGAPGGSEVSDGPETDGPAEDPTDVSEEEEESEPAAEQAPDLDPVGAPSTTVDGPWVSASTLGILCGIGAGSFALMVLVGRLSSAPPVDGPRDDQAEGGR